MFIWLGHCVISSWPASVISQEDVITTSASVTITTSSSSWRIQDVLMTKPSSPSWRIEATSLTSFLWRHHWGNIDNIIVFLNYWCHIDGVMMTSLADVPHAADVRYIPAMPCGIQIKPQLGLNSVVIVIVIFVTIVVAVIKLLLYDSQKKDTVFQFVAKSKMW